MEVDGGRGMQMSLLNQGCARWLLTDLREIHDVCCSRSVYQMPTHSISMPFCGFGKRGKRV